MPDIKERPILFSGAMVRAILDGSKTQTRRVMKDSSWTSPPYSFTGEIKESLGYPASESHVWAGFNILGEAFKRSSIYAKCLYGKPGDRLWVRETWTAAMHAGYAYRADKDGEIDAGIYAWKPSIHMPRSACRIILEITEIRVERLQDISEEDAEAEGAFEWLEYGEGDCIPESPYESFITLWNRINAKRGFGWDANPWVWVIDFRRIEND